MGSIVPPRDAQSLAKSFLRYLNERELLRTQSIATLAKVRQFTMDRLAASLLALENQAQKSKSKHGK